MGILSGCYLWTHASTLYHWNEYSKNALCKTAEGVSLMYSLHQISQGLAFELNSLRCVS